MSDDNVEIVRSAFHTFGAEGIDAALSFFSPDVVWYPIDRWLDDPAYRGHDGIRRLSAAFSENFDDFRYDVHDIRDAQDRVVALVDMTGRIKHSQTDVTQRRGFVISGFFDGKLREVRSFPNWSEALKAAGLEGQASSQENALQAPSAEPTTPDLAALLRRSGASPKT